MRTKRLTYKNFIHNGVNKKVAVKHKFGRERLEFYFKDLEELIDLDFNLIGGALWMFFHNELKDFLVKKTSDEQSETLWFKRWKKFLPENFDWNNDVHWQELEWSVQMQFAYDLHSDPYGMGL